MNALVFEEIACLAWLDIVAPSANILTNTTQILVNCRIIDSESFSHANQVACWLPL